MMKLIKGHHFHKNYKKYCKDQRWEKFVFNNNYMNIGMSSFEYVIYCLINNKRIPAYFHEHPLKGFPNNKKKQIARKLNMSIKNVKVLELHFNGRSSNFLLMYSKYRNFIDIINIGTHEDFFG